MWACWITSRALTAYQDGELGVGRARRIEVHLRTCRRCQGELAALRQVDHLLGSLPLPSRPQAYWPQAFSDVRRKIRHDTPWPRLPLPQTCRAMLESPALAMIPAALVGLALVNALIFLGVEEEALSWFVLYLVPMILQ